MRISLPYGESGTIEAEVPDRNLAGVTGPREVRVTGGEIERALSHPCGGRSLEDFLKDGEDLVIIVNDGTRPTPTLRVLDVLKDRMDLRQARYLIATGAHRAPTEEELRFIFGRHLDMLRDRILVHDARSSPTVHLGRSKNDTEMHVNRIAVEADRLIIITSVEPHYFAGYTGGRKSFLPGVASFKTIEQNHRLAMRSEAKALVLEGNPVHEDMMDALSVVKKEIFSIQVVLDRHQEIYRAATGELHEAFHRAIVWADQVFSIDIPKRYDAVITVAPYPMDVDLYQSQKAIDNAKWALKKGGTLILVSKCREGVGDDTFVRQLSRSPDPQTILQALADEYRLGYHKAANMAEIMCQAEVWAVTGLPTGVLEGMNVTPFPSLQEAVDRLLSNKPDAEILVLLDGSVTVPKVREHE
ncbi:MAG: nickel-dependent lactate racemase [Methanomassiliicoccales archaeon]|nr:nickel-dependent lactate racemase [Methanomassiliicoccales archaeon]TFG56980.1 MAG: nickel-dependent lactate racemase [Methanomassiliicoccus sp.]